jgi:hypothetical protein
MHSPLEFSFQGTQLGAHPITARLAVKREEAVPRSPTDVREPTAAPQGAGIHELGCDSARAQCPYECQTRNSPGLKPRRPLAWRDEP